MRQIPLLAAIRGLRSFSFGYISYLVPLYLYHIGFSIVEVGIYAFIATIASSFLLLLSGFLGDMYSKRNTLILVSILPGLAFLAFLLTRNFYIVFATALLGLSFSAIGGGAGGGPVAPVMNALVADIVERQKRTRTYSNLMIISIIGAILGGFVASRLEVTIPSYYAFLFLLAFLLTIGSIFLMLFLEEKKVESEDPPPDNKKKGVLPTKSVRNIGLISLAGMMGSLGLGVVTPLMSIYFSIIGFTDSQISDIFTLSYLAAGIGVVFASFFERSFGTINSVVVLRLFGSGLFVLIPFVSPVIAAIVYISRTGIYQMALPIRQNFQMSIIISSERARGNSLTGISRRIPYGIATTFGSYLMALGAYAVMFSFAGLVSLLDPILYYIFFSKMSADESEN
ncbi:MAG: MFS transporter [Thermoplasmata archaeon]